MKKIALLASLALGLFMSVESQAQVRINVQIGAPVVQQSWYDYDDDYYYMPEVGVYYNVRRRVYVYPDNGRWIYGASLPGRYNGFCYNDSRFVRIHDRAPFSRHDYYSRHYQVNNYRGDNPHDYGRGDNRGWDRNNRHWNNDNNGGYRNNNYNGGWNGGNGGGHGRGR